MKINDKYEILREQDHYIVLLNGEFYCSADTVDEALQDIKECEKCYEDSKEE